MKDPKQTAPSQDRRSFLCTSAWVAIGAGLGYSLTPMGPMESVALAVPKTPFRIAGKHPDLRILNTRPVNAETPAHLLHETITSTSRLFVRNNGIPPSLDSAEAWTLNIGGEAVKTPVRFTLAELKARFTHYSYQLVLECAGNGRAEFHPPARGNQWTTGAVGCVKWTGIRLRDLLAQCNLTKNAVYVAYEGADKHLSGATDKRPISRGVPLQKALEDQCLVAWALNDQPIPLLHGHPLRLVIPGYPGSCSGKWLQTLLVRDRIHDGAKMNGKAYRVPCKPVAPGQQIEDSEMCIIEAMPTKSLITYPRSGISHPPGTKLAVRGHAWSGRADIAAVHISTDYGQTWQPTVLTKAPNAFAWQQFAAEVPSLSPGYYEIWARATDTQGQTQPMILPGWNPKGYVNNACHRVALRVT